MRTSTTFKSDLEGWLWVVVQVVLLIGLVFIPPYLPIKKHLYLYIVGVILVLIGIIMAIIASRNLGSSLTATPVPKNTAKLRDNGLYKYVRHPIYSSVLTTGFGIVLLRPAGSTLIIFILLIIFFNFKSRFEEKLLLIRFSEYEEYIKRTNRFLPPLK